MRAATRVEDRAHLAMYALVVVHLVLLAAGLQHTLQPRPTGAPSQCHANPGSCT
jgi:hypothetical protein